MKTVLSVFFVFTTHVLFAQFPLQKTDVVIRHANVITMRTEEVLPDRAILIRDQKIWKIIPDTLPAKLIAKVMDAKGGYLMPGMADMHCHFPGSPKMQRYFALQLLCGVTTLRSMRGNDEHLSYRNNTAFPVPHLYLSPSPISSDTSYSIAMAETYFADAAAKGYDFVKILALRDSSSFAHIMQVANNYHMPVAGHLPGTVSYATVLNAGYRTIEHLGGLMEVISTQGESAFIDLIQAHVKSRTYHCPTVNWYQVAYWYKKEDELMKCTGYAYATPGEKNEWKSETQKNIQEYGADKINQYAGYYKELRPYHLLMIKYLGKNTDLLLVGVDGGGYYSVAGFAMLDELELYKEAGLSNFEILKAATVNAARAMDQEMQWGTLEEGKQVNMILLHQNPLESLAALQTVETVFLDDHVWKSKDLKKQLSKN